MKKVIEFTALVQFLLVFVGLASTIGPARLYMIRDVQGQEVFARNMPTDVADLLMRSYMALGAIGMAFALTAACLGTLLWKNRFLRAAKILSLVQVACVPFGVVPGIATFVILQQPAVREVFSRRAGAE